MYLSTSKKVEGSLSSICVFSKDDKRHSIVFNVKKFICLLILWCHLTFTIIFYYHAVINTFIQWKETISDAYLTDTPSCFPFIDPNISPLPQRSLASIPSNTLILFFLAQLKSQKRACFLNVYFAPNWKLYFRLAF